MRSAYLRRVRWSPVAARKRWVPPLAANGVLIARWGERDPQMLLVPPPDRFRILSSEEESSDSHHFFHFRSYRYPIAANSVPSMGSRDSLLFDFLRGHGEFPPSQDEARPEN